MARQLSIKNNDFGDLFQEYGLAGKILNNFRLLGNQELQCEKIFRILSESHILGTDGHTVRFKNFRR